MSVHYMDLLFANLNHSYNRTSRSQRFEILTLYRIV